MSSNDSVVSSPTLSSSNCCRSMSLEWVALLTKNGHEIKESSHPIEWPDRQLDSPRFKISYSYRPNTHTFFYHGGQITQESWLYDDCLIMVLPSPLNWSKPLSLPYSTKPKCLHLTMPPVWWGATTLSDLLWMHCILLHAFLGWWQEALLENCSQ